MAKRPLLKGKSCPLALVFCIVFPTTFIGLTCFFWLQTSRPFDPQVCITLLFLCCFATCLEGNKLEKTGFWKCCWMEGTSEFVDPHKGMVIQCLSGDLMKKETDSDFCCSANVGYPISWYSRRKFERKKT